MARLVTGIQQNTKCGWGYLHIEIKQTTVEVNIAKLSTAELGNFVSYRPVGIVCFSVPVALCTATRGTNVARVAIT
jgi:hypothetical protein